MGIQPFCSLISATFWEPNLFGNQTFLGIQPFWESNRFVSIIKLSLLQDFATQVYHWTDYQKAVRDAQGTPGKYVTPALGEWLHGPTLMIPTFTKSIHRGNKTLHTHTLGQCHAMAQAFHKDGRILLSEAVCLETPRRALPWMAAKVWLLLLRGVHGQFVHFTLLCWCSFFT